MSGKILVICQSCAEHNNGEWKGKAMAPALQGPCDCCKKVKTVTAIQYWRGIRPDDKLEAAPEKAATKKQEPKIEGSNDAPPANATGNAPAPNAPAGNANKGKAILGKK